MSVQALNEPSNARGAQVRQRAMSHGRLATAVISLGLAIAPAQAQEDSATPAEPWATQCVGASREVPLDCSMEQRVVESRNGRVLASVRIRVPTPGAGPVMLIRMPLGVQLSAGVTVNIDGAEFDTFAFQTCDQNGCFVGTTVSDRLLELMRGGQTMELAVQGQNGQPAKVPVSLEGFTRAHSRIR